MITKERAEQIRQSIWGNHGWKGCETFEEDKEIKKFWDTLPGWTCYYDAVCRMAKGEHLK